MNLPPLPDLHPGVEYRAGEVLKMLQAYGKRCRKAAFKDAAKAMRQTDLSGIKNDRHLLQYTKSLLMGVANFMDTRK